jgi:[ribosomal protein S5]-alanine N-acetyltransferase
MFPELSTERLLLQQIFPEDQPFIFEGLNHPAVIRFYGVSYQTFEATAAQMKWYQTMVAEGQGIPWKMVDKVSGEKIGVIAVYFYKPEHQKAEVGFWLLPQFWYKGYALEALKAVVYYWQTEKQLHRMEALVEEGNQGSSKVLEKAGFVFEGTMRECEIKNGCFISLRIYSLITV